MKRPDFNSYSTAELFDVLENIDDIAHPIEAKEVLTLLLKKTGKSSDEILKEYEGDAFEEFMSRITLVVFGAERNNQQVEEKIKRIVSI